MLMSIQLVANERAQMECEFMHVQAPLGLVSRVERKVTFGIGQQSRAPD